MIHIDLPTEYEQCPSVETSQLIAKKREAARKVLETSTDAKERTEAEDILAQCYAL